MVVHGSVSCLVLRLSHGVRFRDFSGSASHEVGCLLRRGMPAGERSFSTAVLLVRAFLLEQRF